MSEVWVLSDEAPFSDPQDSGGLVVGVFATAAAAIFALGTQEIGPEGVAAIMWSPLGQGYEGVGFRDCVYILQRYGIETEEVLRARCAAEMQTYGYTPDPYMMLTTTELMAILACDTDKAEAKRWAQ